MNIPNERHAEDDGTMDMRKLLRCYAERHHGQWEAFCLDFDIAVQGSSFEEVYHDLNVAVTDYVERVSGLPTDDRDRMLHRWAPFWSRIAMLGCGCYHLKAG